MSKQMKFKGDRRWWTIRATDERFTILTRQREFHPSAEVVYTILDRERGVRGPCNALGQGWDFNVDTLDDDAALLLAALNIDVEVSYRNNIPIQIEAER